MIMLQIRYKKLSYEIQVEKKYSKKLCQRNKLIGCMAGMKPNIYNV